MKRDCLKFLAVSFSKIDEVSFNAIISFSPIIVIIVIITIGFLILILFIWLYFQFIVYHSLLSILFISIFFPFIFISYFKFIFVPFFLIYFPFRHFSFLLCFKWDHRVLHLHVIIFSFIPTGLLKILGEERQDHPNCRENSIHFVFAVVFLIIGLELDKFILYFSPPSHTYHLTGHPTSSSAILVAKIS